MTTDKKWEKRMKTILGNIGEEIAVQSLAENGFESVRNLNSVKNNFPFADVYAEKDGNRYVISVKARRKYGANRKPNPSYNLAFGGGDERAEKVEKEYNAKAHWIAIPMERCTYTFYFGSLQGLGGSKSINMKKCEEGKIGQYFVRDKELSPILHSILHGDEIIEICKYLSMNNDE